LKKGLLRAAVTNLTQSGRTVTTTSLRGFFMLWAVSKLRPFRRLSLRFIEETGHLEAWLSLVTKTAASHLPLAIELAELRNLVKGYGDTHVRGRANYADIFRLLPAITETSDPAKTLQMLRKAALADDTGTKLSEVLTGLGLSHA
jgi:indolepyruvate ferredoxin oxidoreductase beta subunit